MARKSNTVRKDGRIAVQVYLGVVDGKRKYKTVYGTTQKEANKKAEQVKISIGKGLDVLSDQDTFGKWRDIFLESKKLDVSNSQYLSYKSYVKHLSPLTETPIAKIKASDLQQIINQLAIENPTTHIPTAKKTLNDIKITAAQIFNLAIDSRVMEYNPASPVKIPQKAPQEHRRALTAEEQGWILNTPHRMQIGAMIMMYAGLRRGELIPLTWADIDLDEHTITINKAVEMISGKPELKDMTKTPAGMRTIDIPKILVDYLTPLKSTGLVLSNNGKMWSDTIWKKVWSSYIKDINFKFGKKIDQNGNMAKSKFNPNGIPITIPQFTPHWLRHTFATLMYFAEVDVVTAKNQLGHSDVKTTLQIYTHLDQTHKRKSMQKLDDFLAMQVRCKSE